MGALGAGGQEEGSGPGGWEVEGHRGPSRPEVDPLDPSGLQVVGAHMGRSQDAGDHVEGPEVIASQGVAAQDSRASATKTIRSIIFHGIIGASSSSLSVLRGCRLCDGGQLSCVCVFLHLGQRLKPELLLLLLLCVGALSRPETRRPRVPDTQIPGSQIPSAAGKADKRLAGKRSGRGGWGEKRRAGS